MPRVNAGDAGKRQQNASKAFPERQPASTQARQTPCVGCRLVGGRRPAVQSAGALFADVEGGSGIDSLRYSPRHQQRRDPDGEAGVHVRAVYQWRVPAVLPSQLEGIDRGHLGADRQIASYPGVREATAPCDPAGRIAGLPRPEGPGFIFQPGSPSAVVPEWDLQAGHVGRADAQQSGGRVEDSEKMPAGPRSATAGGRGGEYVPGGLRPSGEVDREARNLRRHAPGRDPGAPVEIGSPTK